jgi:hypothetical protein
MSSEFRVRRYKNNARRTPNETTPNFSEEENSDGDRF